MTAYDTLSPGRAHRWLRPLLVGLLLTPAPAWSEDVWPQPESAYQSDQPRAQWLHAPRAATPAQPAPPAPVPATPGQPGAPIHGGVPGYPPVGQPVSPAPYGQGWPAYGWRSPYPYPPPAYRPPVRSTKNRWWPDSWPGMDDFSSFSMPDMPSPSFSTPSFSMPANPFGW